MDSMWRLWLGKLNGENVNRDWKAYYEAPAAATGEEEVAAAAAERAAKKPPGGAGWDGGR